MRELAAGDPIELDDDLLVRGDNLPALAALPEGAFDLVYMDPPFNTGRRQRRATTRAERTAEGDGLVGFGGHRYRSQLLRALAYDDEFEDYLGFLAPRIEAARRALAGHGTLYFHIDYREAHYCKLLLDELFGRECFLNEIIWAYDYGGRPKRRWPAKHDTILVYVKDPARYHFDSAEVEREPYMAPGLVTAEKAARGKLPTDCYCADTEVLTDRGWLAFGELRESDQVAGMTPEHQLVFSHPTRLHRIPYDGELVGFRSATVDLLVTPNHSMYVRGKHDRDYAFRSADAMAGSPSAYFALANRMTWAGETNPSTFQVPSVEYKRAYCAKPLPEFEMGDWCEFMGWYLSEGSTTVYRDRREVHITQIADPAKVERLRTLLARMGFAAHYNGRSFVICNRQLLEYLRPLGKAHDKHVPRVLLLLPPLRLIRLCDGLMAGDGSIRNRGPDRRETWTYHTVSARLADDVQELFLKLGFSASITCQVPENERWRPKYTVTRRTAKESTVWPERHRRSERYTGFVHCATVVPHHTLVVRRNGRVVVSGNCWWHTIVPTNGGEKTGYPTQKPEGIVRRMVAASSRPGGWCLDPFAGSGTLGAVARGLGRRFVLMDSNPEALDVMRARLGSAS